MKIYLLTQNDNNGYDTFDSIIVCAKNCADAKTIDPYDKQFIENEPWGDWAKKSSSIICKEIGTANKLQKRGVILASFNAG